MNEKYKININKTINKILFVMVIGIVTNAGTVMAEEFSNIKTDTVCFNSIYNGNTYNITGTIFYKSVSPSNLIITVHGFVNDRNVWDGGILGPDEDSYARTLVNAGYVVITYDRLGYGQSKIPGAGFTIDSEVQLQNLRDIIVQIKNGSNSCSSTKFKFDKIILIGHSGGAAIIESYATQYHDVAAIVPMTPPGPPGFETNAEFYNNIIINWIIPKIYAGSDYVTMFPPGSNGISQDCLHFFFDPDNTNPKISNIYCSNENLKTSPSGEYLSALEFWNKTHTSIPKIEKNLPVLLVFADNDLLFNESQKAERNYWKQNCECDISILRTETGHMLMFHRSSKDTIEQIIDWLHSNGL